LADGESEQWVAEVAKMLMHVILTKVRYSDRDVEVSIPHVAKYKDFVPVLVDDIISTGRTMIETIGHLNNAGMKPLFVLTCVLLKTRFRN
jgi:ribose-phosphate pyrophosphokinase